MSSDRIRALIVNTPQGDAGLLEKDSRFVFNYSLAGGDRQREISLRMPIRAESYASSVLPPIFAMNRPEGYLYFQIMQRVAKHVNPDDMFLLSIVGENQIGRLTYRLPEDGGAKKARAKVGRAQLLHEPRSQALFEELVESYFDSGISGVQPKVMVPDSDKAPVAGSPGIRKVAVYHDLVVKSSGADYPWLSQNEFLCLDAARRAGLQVPNFDLSDDGNLLVLDRFDIKDGKRLGLEDFAVLLEKRYDVTGNYKYQGSYENIALAIRQLCGEGEAVTSCQRYFEYVTLSVLVRNGDAHLKNFSLIYDTPADARPRLSPIYDVVTTTLYEHVNAKTGVIKTDRTMALKFAKNANYPTREQLINFGTQYCFVRKPEAVIERLSDAMSDTLEANASRVDQQLVAKLREEWDTGRASVAPPTVYANPAAKLPNSR